MTAHECAVYIGCGTDFEPVSDLSSVSNFVYIDSQPLTSYGDLYQSFVSKNQYEFYNKTYMSKFASAAQNAGFKKISLDGVYPDVYKNFNTNQQVCHYYSLCFPFTSFKQNVMAGREDIIKLIGLLNHVSHLVVRGYVPTCNIFRYFLRPVVFVGYDDTCYVENLASILPYERNKITVMLQQNQYREKFSDYICVSTGQNRERLYASTYDEFVSKILNLKS